MVHPSFPTPLPSSPLSEQYKRMRACGHSPADFKPHVAVLDIRYFVKLPQNCEKKIENKFIFLERL